MGAPEYPGFSGLALIDFHADMASKYSAMAREAFMNSNLARYLQHAAKVAEHIDAMTAERAALPAAKQGAA